MNMNRVIPIIGIMVLAIAAVVILSSGGHQKRQADMMSTIPEAPAPDADTPADTVRALSAQVADLTNQTKELLEKNEQLARENEKYRASESVIARRVQDKIQADFDRQNQTNESQTKTAISALTAKVESLRDQMVGQMTTPGTSGDIPVGFGYDGDLSGGVHWIDALDAPPVGPDGQPVKDDPFSQSSLLYPQSGGVQQQIQQQTPGGVLQGADNEEPPSTPVYTIPANSTLMGSTAFSALIGRVPIDGQVQDPMPFKVLIGADNLAANGHSIPGLQGMVMSGYAIGDWNLACVSGTVTSALFVFEDGRTVNFGENKRAQNGKLGDGIGWISDPYGVPCISGKPITNAPAFLTQRVAVMALKAAAEAYSSSQTTTTVSPEGVANTSVTGDQGKYVLGETLSGGSDEITDWLTKRQAQSFDAVFVHAGAKLTVHLDVSLPIDYHPNGRMLDHRAQPQLGGAYGYLD